MSWKTLTVDDVLNSVSPQEAATMQAIAGDKAASFVSLAVDEARGSIRAGGYQLGPDGTTPDQLDRYIIAVARWEWLTSFPLLQKLQTKERQDSYTAATARLDLVANQKLKIEPYVDAAAPRHKHHAPAAGTWNSENKLIPRTHPVPPPGMQFEATPENEPPYANPRERDEPGRPVNPSEGYPDA